MSETMRAAVFENTGRIVVKDVPKPQISKATDVIIKIELCSICGTDVHIMSIPPGYIATPNTILGHELVGTVEAVGDGVKTLQLGDRIICNPNEYCGVCFYCRDNMPNLCENIQAMGIDVDGGFAEFVRISENMCHKISQDLPAEIAVFAEPLACVINGMDKMRVNPSESVAIIGAGTIGLLFCKYLKATGAYPIIVSEPVARRRQKALESGADYVVDPLNEDLETLVKTVTMAGVDYVIEAVGNQISECISLVRKGGTILLFGVNASARPVVVQELITKKEISILGTWLANASFPHAVRVLENGKINFGDLITHTIPLERIAEGIEILAKGDGIEVLVSP